MAFGLMHLHCSAIAGFSCHVYISSWQVWIEYSKYTAKQYPSDCDEQHNTHRPTVNVNQVLPNEYFRT